MNLRVGEFTLDDERRQLVRDGEVVHVSPKGYELPKLLASERPRAVSRAGLHERLARYLRHRCHARQRVAEVRSALGDASGS